MLIKKRVYSIHQQKMPKSFRLQPFFRIVTTVAKRGARHSDLYGKAKLETGISFSSFWFMKGQRFGEWNCMKK